MKEFLKTTIVGGLLFLLPVALVLFILGYAVRAVTNVVQPISRSLGLDRLGGDIGGIGAVTVFAILLLVLVSFVAGIFARTGVGARITRWLEDRLLVNVPHYRLVKGMAQGFAQIESTSGMKPALVSLDAGWQLGYLLEPLENGWVAVFLPQAPSAVSGNVMYLAGDRVRPLGITMVQAMTVVNSMGVGSAQALRGVDLGPAKGR
jgi:uncharacterized membrane protein